MTLSIIVGSFLSITGILSLFLGIIFLIAARGESSKLTVAGVLGGVGIALLIAGIKLFRKGIRETPSGARKSILRLARINNGELSYEAITGELGNSDTVQMQLQELLKHGVCSDSIKNGRQVYIFPDFQVKLVMKQCPYCGNDYPVRDDIERCPSCGGDLTMHRSAVAGRNDRYSMDDDDDSGLA